MLSLFLLEYQEMSCRTGQSQGANPIPECNEDLLSDDGKASSRKLSNKHTRNI